MKIYILVASLLVTAGGYAQNAGGIDLSKIDSKLIQQGMQMLQTMTPEERAAAVEAAKAYVHAAIENSYLVGRGCGVLGFVGLQHAGG